MFKGVNPVHTPPAIFPSFTVILPPPGNKDTSLYKKKNKKKNPVDREFNSVHIPITSVPVILHPRNKDNSLLQGGHERLSIHIP